MDKGNDREKMKAYVGSQGSRQSANEHLIPEQLFSTEQQKIEGVSAVKALGIAAQQGQKIFTITRANAAVVLPQLSHRATVMDDIRAAIHAGKVVTVSQSQVTHAGWTGTGYVIADANTGAGAYLIGGGADGAICLALGTIGLVVAASAIIPAIASGPLLVASLVAVTAALSASILLIMKGLALLDQSGHMRGVCAGYASSLMALSVGGLSAAGSTSMGLFAWLFSIISISQRLNAIVSSRVCGG